MVARPVGMFSIYFMPGGEGVMLFVDFIPFFVDFKVGGGGKGMSRNAFLGATLIHIRKIIIYIMKFYSSCVV